jgi:hypothetical protein
MKLIFITRVLDKKCYDLQKVVLWSDLAPIPRVGEYVELAEDWDEDWDVNAGKVCSLSG